MSAFLFLAACGGKLVDGILLPDVDDATFVQGVDNPWFPLPVGATWSYAADTEDGLETIEVQVLAETREVNGVTATIVYDVASMDGEIAEETWDWFAQDDEGNVWYLGEDTCEFVDGECADRVGEWEWGVDGALPGVVMWADPKVDGQPYFQEYYEGEAEDVGEVIAVDEAIDAPTGSYTGCVRTADTSHIEADLYEEKVFCPGVGNVYVKEGEVDVWLEELGGL